MTRTLTVALLAVGLAVLVACAPPQTGETPLFVCGEDAVLDEEIPLRWETIVLAADGRLYGPCGTGEPHPPEHREQREIELLSRAENAQTSPGESIPASELRRLAAQAYGRTTPTPGPFRSFERRLADPDAGVRREAAVAIGALLNPAVREPPGVPAGTSDETLVAAGRLFLERRLAMEEDERVVSAILETLGRLSYADDASRGEVEALLAGHIPSSGEAHQLLGAVRGLEALFRRNRRHEAAPETVERLRGVVTHISASEPMNVDARPGATGGDLDVFAQARRAAMLALTSAGDSDASTVLSATRDLDWQVRRLGVLGMDPERPEFVGALEAALSDTAFQVRFEAVRIVGRAALRTGDCAALIAALDDTVPAVVMSALDALGVNCAGQESWLPGLVETALTLEREPSAIEWHVPSRAAVAVARVAPAESGPLLAAALEHPAWQARAAAAEMAEILADESTALQLAADREPNVRTAALGVLQALDSPALFSAAVDGLQSDDFDLIRTSARLLEGTPGRAAAVRALLSTLGRLTDAAWDTSRDPRLAIVERLGELLAPEQASSLLPYVDDFDLGVSVAASGAVMKLTGADEQPAARRHIRYPYQPDVEDLAVVPRLATIRMEGGGLIELEFILDQAPVATARFAELVRDGYYDGLTFHRFAPNFVIQGGSPGANEYSGAPRYLRDEIGAPNVRGTVGLSTRGRDTGDGQIFINLVDNLRLDGDYTVFARVVSGMDVVDAVLPGATIETITVR